MNKLLEKFGYSNINIREELLMLIVAILVLSVYSNTLQSPFVFDDRSHIASNPHIRITELTFDNISRAAFNNPLANRPIVTISFALNYYFHGYDVAGYHLVNILIHIINSLLVYYFLKTTLMISMGAYAVSGRRNGIRRNLDVRNQREISFMAFSAAAIWAVHPLHTQSVTYIVQRMNSMAAMFYILSFLLYVKGRIILIQKTSGLIAHGSKLKAEKIDSENEISSGKTKDTNFLVFSVICFFGSFFFGMLSFGSKQIAVTLPFFICLYELFFFQDLKRKWLKVFGIAVPAALVFLTAIILLINFDKQLIEIIIKSYDQFDFTLKQRVLTEFRVVIYYISLLFFPHPSRLIFDYNFPISFSLIEPVTTLFSIVTVFVLIILACVFAKRERLLSFSILWFFGNLVLESSVIGLDIVFEHRTYLPSMMLFLIPVLIFSRINKVRWAGIILLSAVIAVCSIWAYERNAVWRSKEIFWRDCVKKSPGNTRAQYNLGRSLIPSGRFDEAAEHFSEALRIDPDYPDARKNLEIARLYSDARKKYSEPDKIHNYLGIVLAKQGSVAHSVRNFIEALRINPEYEEAHYNLGRVLLAKGEVDKAVMHFNTALKINPDYANALTWLEKALLIQKKAGG